MRISGQPARDTVVQTANPIEEKAVAQGSTATSASEPIQTHHTNDQLDNSEETKAKVRQAVDSMNELLETTNNASKFMFHEGLERYYVTVVNRETEEVVKEIPPKRLLDAFYEMQKMLGMIVDEKI